MSRRPSRLALKVLTFLLWLTSWCAVAAHSSNDLNRVTSVIEDAGGSFLVLNTDGATQVAAPSLQYLPGGDGETIMVADFYGLIWKGPPRTFFAPVEDVQLVRIGQLQANPPICRVSVTTRQPAALKRLAFGAQPGNLIIRWTSGEGKSSATTAPGQLMAPPRQASAPNRAATTSPGQAIAAPGGQLLAPPRQAAAPYGQAAVTPDKARASNRPATAPPKPQQSRLPAYLKPAPSTIAITAHPRLGKQEASAAPAMPGDRPARRPAIAAESQPAERRRGEDHTLRYDDAAGRAGMKPPPMRLWPPESTTQTSRDNLAAPFRSAISPTGLTPERSLPPAGVTAASRTETAGSHPGSARTAPESPPGNGNDVDAAERPGSKPARAPEPAPAVTRAPAPVVAPAANSLPPHAPALMRPVWETLGIRAYAMPTVKQPASTELPPKAPAIVRLPQPHFPPTGAQAEVAATLTRSAQATGASVQSITEDLTGSTERKSGDELPKVVLTGTGPVKVEVLSSKPLAYRSFRLSDPERHVIDIQELPELLDKPLPEPEPNPYLNGVRVGKLDGSDNITRLVLDLSGPEVKVKESFLPAEQKLAIMLERALPSFGEIKLPPGKTVVLDPGHGGSDPGAQRGDIQEKALTLAITDRVRRILERQGVNVTVTRSDDSFVSLEDRVNLTNTCQPDAFLSIHINSLETNSNIHGIETYYQTDQSKDLALFVHDALVKNLQAPDRSVRKAKFYVINHTPHPAVLAEVGFISNKGERDKLISSDYQSEVAAALAQGVMLYIAKQSEIAQAKTNKASAQGQQLSPQAQKALAEKDAAL